MTKSSIARTFEIREGDALSELCKLKSQSVQCIITSPPYWGLRDYGVDGQIGLERTLARYLQRMRCVFREAKRVLRRDGVLWMNMGDAYAGTGYGAGADAQTNLGNPHSRPADGSRVRDDKRGYRGARLANGRGDSPAVHRAKTVGSGSELHVPRPSVPGLRRKNILGLPWRVAFALQDDGWILRQDVVEEIELYCPCGCGHVLEERVVRNGQDRDFIWSKPNPMPESVRDRCTKSHEYVFLFSRSRHYYFDADAIAEPRATTNGSGVAGWVTGSAPHRPVDHALAGWNRPRDKGDAKTFRAGQYVARNKFENSHAAARDSHGNAAPKRDVRNARSVWTIATEPCPEAHFATFPKKLVERCVLAGTKPGDVVLDPFAGSGTSGIVALALEREFIGIELNPEYAAMARRRIVEHAPLFNTEARQA